MTETCAICVSRDSCHTCDFMTYRTKQSRQKNRVSKSNMIRHAVLTSTRNLATANTEHKNKQKEFLKGMKVKTVQDVKSLSPATISTIKIHAHKMRW